MRRVRLRAIRRLPPAVALQGTGPAAGAAAARAVRPCPRRRGHRVAGLRGPPLHTGLPSMGGPPGALLAGHPATETQPPGSAAASSEGGGLASRCPPERRERIVGEVNLKERPRGRRDSPTAPPRLPSPDPRGGSEYGPRPSAALPGAEDSYCQALRPRLRVAAWLRACRPSRSRRAGPAPARGGRRGWRSARRRDPGSLSSGGRTPERPAPRPSAARFRAPPGPAAVRSCRPGKRPGWPASCRMGSWTCSIPRYLSGPSGPSGPSTPGATCMRAWPPALPGGGLVRLDAAGPLRSLPWRGPWWVRSPDRDCRCRRRAIGRGIMGHTPQVNRPWIARRLRPIAAATVSLLSGSWMCGPLPWCRLRRWQPRRTAERGSLGRMLRSPWAGCSVRHPCCGQ